MRPKLADETLYGRMLNAWAAINEPNPNEGVNALICTKPFILVDLLRVGHSREILAHYGENNDNGAIGYKTPLTRNLRKESGLIKTEATRPFRAPWRHA